MDVSSLEMNSWLTNTSFSTYKTTWPEVFHTFLRKKLPNSSFITKANHE